MSNEIYNEGRVVGYSAEEAFDKVFHYHFPNEDLPTTQEWLSTSMGMGTSFALHIHKETTSRSVMTYTFPAGSSNVNNNLKGLSGRYLVIATPIYGTATYVAGSSDYIAPITEITGIKSNVSTSYNPNGIGYANILNGVVEYGSAATTIKILVDNVCDCDILFTGFLNSKIVEVMKLSAGTTELGRTYTDIAEFGNNLLPDVSQILFSKPNYREYFTANVVNSTDEQGSLIDISQVDNSSTLSTAYSIITPSNVDYANASGRNGATKPNLLSIQQHSHTTQGGQVVKINPSLYFYNPTTGKLEPVDSDAKGAVNIIKRFQFTNNEANDLQALKDQINHMINANKDKIFIGAWVANNTTTDIDYLILPGGNYIEELGDLLTTLKNSGEGEVRIYAQRPISMPSDYASYTNYGIWD